MKNIYKIKITNIYKICTSFIFNIFNQIKLYITRFFYKKKLEDLKQTKLVVNENKIFYFVTYSSFKQTLENKDLENDMLKLKNAINFKNDYFRIYAEIFCKVESLDKPVQLQTKVYSLTFKEYDSKVDNLFKELIAISERYRVNSILSIKYTILRYNKNYKLTLKEFQNLTKKT